MSPDELEELEIASETLDAVRRLLLQFGVMDSVERLAHVSATIRMGENRINTLREKRKKNASGNLAQL